MVTGGGGSYSPPLCIAAHVGAVSKCLSAHRAGETPDCDFS